MTSRGQRGRSLERAVRRLFKSYESMGIHCQKNSPEQLYDGTLVRKHGFDFQIFYQGKFYAFDAKECAAPKWPLEKAKPHQLNALLIVRKNHGYGFFLVYFTKQKKLVRFDAEVVRKAIADKRHSLAPEDGVETRLDILNGTWID